MATFGIAHISKTQFQRYAEVTSAAGNEVAKSGRQLGREFVECKTGSAGDRTRGAAGVVGAVQSEALTGGHAGIA